MKLLDRYLLWNVLLSTLFGLVVLSLFLVLGNAFRELLNLIVNRGLPWGSALSITALILPFTLTFTIPWAFLAALLLCFGRLSADNELTAMQASGVSLTRCCAPVFALAMVLSGVCVWINAFASPLSQQAMYATLRELAVSNPMSLFPTDEVIDSFAGLRIFISGKDADRMTGVRIFEVDEEGLPKRAIFAKSATLSSDSKKAGVILHLWEARFEERAKNSTTILGMRPGLSVREGSYPVSPREFFEANRRNGKLEARTLSELRTLMKTGTDSEKFQSRLEAHRRFSGAGACVAFAWIAVPLGITAHRRESLIGFGLSLILAFGYYLINIFGQALIQDQFPHPLLLIWLPNVLLVLLGTGLFWRIARR